MKPSLLLLISALVFMGCSDSRYEDESPSTPKIEFVKQNLDLIHMDKRIEHHYEGGDIGLFFAQFAWSDSALTKASQDFGAFIDFFDSVREAAINKDLTAHTPINNFEIAMIFFAAYPTENSKVYSLDQFGDIEANPVPVSRFYKILDFYRTIEVTKSP